jgi:hypothetical protein
MKINLKEPGGQKQIDSLFFSKHIPPFIHGLGLHE